MAHKGYILNEPITILEVRYGSHLYGTDTPSSDLDMRYVYVPGGWDIVLGTVRDSIHTGRTKEPFERNTKDHVDAERVALKYFLESVMEGQTWALDVLFAFGNKRAECPGMWGLELMKEIFSNRERLLTRNIAAFVGYARKQAARYGIKGSRMDAVERIVKLLTDLPAHDRLVAHAVPIGALISSGSDLLSMEKTPLMEFVDLPGPKGSDSVVQHLQVCGRKFPMTGTVKEALDVYGKILKGYGERSQKAHLEGGVDWKALSHAVRVNEEANELLEKGWITFPRPEREGLIRIKTGQIPKEVVYEEIEAGVARLHAAYATSLLRDEPDRDWVNNFVYGVYSEQV